MSVGSMKLDHIGIAVRSIDECLKIWQDILGLQLNMVKNIPKQKVKVAVLDLKNIKIELLEATEEESTLDKFIEKRGEGLHHLCFEVKEIESVLSDIKEQG
ncbi:MAG: VOC family protein, partial [Candidatus Marinimicrobia bacterium]|nr:VOC family protein [Candidatus Neomarinimicrobiota bacterium]